MPAIRPAVVADAAQIAELLVQLGYPSTPEAVQVRLANLERAGGYACFVADWQGRVAGLIALARDWYIEKDGAYVRIVALVVDEAARGQGLGRALLAQAECWARDNDAGSVLLNSGDHRGEAHAFYRHHGYRSTGLRFVKPLDPATDTPASHS
ncbi:N-acetyltransferase GCN5 [Chitiniphilus shinanonensis]|uniref:N-acetyltransferase GCN5 n=1 Tax=Chitiniphilus shinanonensis TaxID=553088 RepID=A0ABQ6BSN5_9NEIS|nr:GNAT family N-acetyltransferase [Chitiniphilus shinanonensis]GLS04220.1 N-acetyltransferase GCN5 [Chitiniphilus shinanonensis]